MEKLNAPLCHSCSELLKESVLDVYRIGGISEPKDVCPWCQRNTPDAIYTIHFHKRK